MSANSSLSSWDEEYVQAARLDPELLKGAGLPHPQAPAARYLVAELTGVEDPSPTFIIETITAVSQPKSVPQLPRVIVEQYEPGVNDLMTGAMNPALQPRRTPEELARLAQEDNNATVCIFDFRYLNNIMPCRLFSIREIATLNIFNVIDNINRLPAGFHTTTMGLKKVWWEIWRGQADAVYGDELLLMELLKVGGVPGQQYSEQAGWGVVYPEDLVPCTSENEWDDDHRTYWKLLADLGRTSWGTDQAGQDEDKDEGVIE
jgi:hypothetical protein